MAEFRSCGAVSLGLAIYWAHSMNCVFLFKPRNLRVHAYDAAPTRREPSVSTLHESPSLRCLMSRELPAEETYI